jgi:hypothetical protein
MQLQYRIGIRTLTAIRMSDLLDIVREVPQEDLVGIREVGIIDSW